MLRKGQVAACTMLVQNETDGEQHRENSSVVIETDQTVTMKVKVIGISNVLGVNVT